MTPHRCPVCEGAGKRGITGYGPALCTACGGTGIVWEPPPNDTPVSPVERQEITAS